MPKDFSDLLFGAINEGIEETKQDIYSETAEEIINDMECPECGKKSLKIENNKVRCLNCNNVLDFNLIINES